MQRCLRKTVILDKVHSCLYFCRKNSHRSRKVGSVSPIGQKPGGRGVAHAVSLSTLPEKLAASAIGRPSSMMIP